MMNCIHNYNMSRLIFSLVALSCCSHVFGHGMVMNPINRASRWRTNETAPTDFDDNQLYCGGFTVQWNQNNGKCGFCGDNYAFPTPRAHELGGLFGEGVIVEKYPVNGVIGVDVRITANHRGFFEFRLCNMDKYGIEDANCFDSILLKQTNGESKYYITSETGTFHVKLQLPEKIECKHCILQWTWTTGNNWGLCPDGTHKEGCGPQETFRTCSDISIQS